jgi:intracellular multiplication protein IcmK
MNKLAKFTFAVFGSALLSQSAFAQVGQPGQAPSRVAGAGSQEGIIYPGQQQGAAPQMNSAVPGAPGTPLKNGAFPTLPALPGEVTPAQQAVNDALPEDTAKELKELKRRVDEVLRVSATPVNTAAKPNSSHVELTQQPGEETPIVRLAPGVPTNLIFTDVTGAPWPIEYAVPGTGGQFEILMPSADTPTLQLRPKTPYAYGGASIKLVGNPIPVSIQVTAAQKIVDVRLDIVILKKGPNAQAPMVDSGSTASMPHDAILTTFLYGIAPSGARELKSTSRSVKAWNYDGLLYVRSTVPLVSPNPIRQSRTVDGTYAYVLPQVPIVNITADGVISSVTVTE